MHAALLNCKGTGDETAATGLRDFRYSTGYTRLELKTDGEPALVEVANAAKEICKAQEIVVKNPLHTIYRPMVWQNEQSEN